uniref:Pentatricopeptide repeat-containing protein At4g04790-like n=1 Tax=Rhizophora mucronata TaxID=61149 RepID=A0A2P2LKP3_RHIMU
MSKVKKLSSIFSSAIKATAGKNTNSPAASDSAFKHHISSIEAPSPHASLAAAAEFSAKPRKSPSISKPERPAPVNSSGLPVLGLLASDSDSEDTTSQLSKQILSALRDSNLDSNGTKNLQTTLNVPWLSQTLNKMSMQRKEVCRSRKQRFIFKSTQHGRCNKLVATCARYVGTDATIQLLGKLGCETGLKEYNAMIKICIHEAKESDDEDVVIKQLSKSYQILRSMKEQGFQLEEETFASILVYLIDMCMVREFHFFCEAIKGYNPSCLAKLGYYEMLLYIRVDDEEKIQELCNHICSAEGAETTDLCVNYLAALCESDRKEEILQLLEITDITKFSSLDHVVNIFKSLGRLSLESCVDKFLLAFKESDHGAEIISTLILNYATSITNLAVRNFS